MESIFKTEFDTAEHDFCHEYLTYLRFQLILLLWERRRCRRKTLIRPLQCVTIPLKQVYPILVLVQRRAFFVLNSKLLKTNNVNVCPPMKPLFSRADGPMPCGLPLAAACQEKPLLCSRSRAEELAQVLLGTPGPTRPAAPESVAPLGATRVLLSDTG